MSKNKDFKPAWWLPSPHGQTVWGSISLRKPPRYERERLFLPDGDFLDIDWCGQMDQPNSPIVVLLHGLGGSSKSHYACGLMKRAIALGWRGAVMNFRGCSGEPNRLARAYHSGETGDMAYVFDVIRQREPNAGIAAVGYSLGGNALLKWMGETGSSNPLQVVVAVSVPFDLAMSADAINQGLSKFYQWVMVRDLQKFARCKLPTHDLPFTDSELRNTKSFWDFDNCVTAPVHGFKDAKDYYEKSSSRQYIPKIAKPTLIIHAVDDPFMSEHVIPEKQELPAQVELELYPGGGHVGFVSGKIPFKPRYWLEERIPTYLQSFLT